MNKIVQLNEEEYNKLNEQASCNQSKIEKLAEEMYKERGTYEIYLSIDIQKDYSEKISFKVDTMVKDYEVDYFGKSRYKIPYKEQKKIVKYINERALEFMEHKFGRKLYKINDVVEKKEKLRLFYNRFTVISILGWLAAATLCIIAILK